MTIREFVTDLFLSSREYDGEHMTVETAKKDLENFAADGWDIPDGITMTVETVPIVEAMPGNVTAWDGIPVTVAMPVMVWLTNCVN